MTARAHPPRRTRARSSVQLGASLESVVETVWAVNGCASRGHPETKVVRTPTGSKVIHLAKNGVDFSGVLYGHPVAVECKRLPGVASLSGAKDDSTRAEAGWLVRYYAKGGRGGFLVYDPEADNGRGTVYAVTLLHDLKAIAVGQPVQLRTRAIPLLPAWNVRDMTEHSIPTGLAGAVDCALRFIARVGERP